MKMVTSRAEMKTMDKPLNRRVAVITGASSGIGKETAKTLVSQGWFVIGLGRNPERCQQAEQDIAAPAGGGSLLMLCGDLAELTEARRIAADIAQYTDRVDALLNNAGGVNRERRLTQEGNEYTFAGNHLGHFLLLRELLPLLRKAAASSEPGATRVVNVSSSAHHICEGVDWDDLQMKDNFVSMVAYSRAKLANLLFTRELAKRLQADGIVVHAMHPGIVGSNFANHGDEALRDYFSTKGDEIVLPEVAAETLIWLASAAEPSSSTGQYFYQKQVAPTSTTAQDDSAAARLWQISEELTA